VEKYQNAQTQKRKADSIPKKEKEAHLNNLPRQNTTEDVTQAQPTTHQSKAVAS
jgi:hypothetical protein